MDSCDTAAPALRCMVVMGRLILSQTTSSCFKVCGGFKCTNDRVQNVMSSVSVSYSSSTLFDGRKASDVEAL